MKNLNIGARLGIGFVAMLILMLAMVIFSVWRLQGVGDATMEIVHHALQKERQATQWHAAVKANGIRTFALMRSDDVQFQKDLQAQIDAQSKSVSTIQKQVEAAISSPEEKKLFEDVGKLRIRYRDTREAIFKLKAAGNSEQAREQTNTVLVKLMDEYSNSVLNYVEYQKNTIDQSAEKIDSDYRSSRILLIALGLTEIILGSVLAWLLTRSITVPLHQAITIAETVAAGDLTSHIVITGKDETGKLLHALKTMNENLLKIVTQVRKGTDTVASVSGEIAHGNLDLSSRTEQQAGSLEETASAMEQLTSTVRQNADNARQASQLAVSASEVAVQGGSVVGQVIETMSAINASSKRIVDIISVIDSIAFQTNILALNAAVEAARAGEQGRGFAVVASEVRGLAQRSAAAAKEIKELIDDSVQKVTSGSLLVEQAGQTMTGVVDSVKRVTDIVGEISMASQEQSEGIVQVNEAIAQMDENTQQNAALVEQAAASAQSLQDQAATLTDVVGVFKLVPSANASFTAAPVKATVATPKSSPKTVRPHGAGNSHTKSVSAPKLKTAPNQSSLRVEHKTSDADWEQF